MPYNVGISTGFWKIGRDPALLGLAQKIAGIGATGGIRFVQVDLESIAEFYEPEIKSQIKQMKEKLNMYAGLHGEIGELMALDSAEKRIWDQTHLRLVQTVKFAAELGFFYVNIHFSNKPLISFTEAQHRTQGYFYPVVDPYGKGLQNIVKGNPQTEEEAVRHMEERVIFRSATGLEEQRKLQEEVEKDVRRRVEEQYQQIIKAQPQLSEAERKSLKREIEAGIPNAVREEIRRRSDDPQFAMRMWLKLKPDEFEKFVLADGEFGAFHIVAKWLKEKNDPLWNSIAKGKNPNDLYFEDENAFCAAIASKYIEGHLTLKDNPANRKHLDGMSIKEWCESKKLYLLLENPESGEGAEGLYRLFHPNHFYHVIKQIDSPYIRVTIDFEHMVSQALDPDEVLKEVPDDFGKLIVLFHLGQPVPYGGTAHIPIARGSLSQEQIYRWLYQLRKKGWRYGYVMFERGGGRTGGGKTPFEVFEDSVAALRQIVKYLDMDVEPKKLPPEFYGISHENIGIFSKQQVAVREHAWDPLEGVLSVPEEKHTFLSGVALQKGKGQEWEKRKLR